MTLILEKAKVYTKEPIKKFLNCYNVKLEYFFKKEISEKKIF